MRGAGGEIQSACFRRHACECATGSFRYPPREQTRVVHTPKAFLYWFVKRRHGGYGEEGRCKNAECRRWNVAEPGGTWLVQTFSKKWQVDLCLFTLPSSGFLSGVNP